MTAICCPPLAFDKFCSFCAGAGIQGPHDHWLRASKRPDAKVTCPALLDHNCEHCGRKGHTKKHCGELKWEIGLKRQEAQEAKKKNWESGGWSTQLGRMRNTEVHPPRTVNKQLTVMKVASRFGALDMDSSGDEEDTKTVREEVAEEIQQIHKDSAGPSWADKVRAAPFTKAQVVKTVTEAIQDQGVEVNTISVIWKTPPTRTQRVSNWADSDDDMDF